LVPASFEIAYRLKRSLWVQSNRPRAARHCAGNRGQWLILPVFARAREK
jgi:hypothetical protein